LKILYLLNKIWVKLYMITREVQCVLLHINYQKINNKTDFPANIKIKLNNKLTNQLFSQENNDNWKKGLIPRGGASKPMNLFLWQWPPFKVLKLWNDFPVGVWSEVLDLLCVDSFIVVSHFKRNTNISNGEGCWWWHLMEHIHNNLKKLGKLGRN
jgi:hypothetical protein